MDSAPAKNAANADQIEYWNQRAGPDWVRFQKQLDGQIRPLGEIAMRRADVKAGEQVLDIGCGCGDSALELARRVGPDGAVRGLDISAPMLARARHRASLEAALKLRFEQGDAQTADLPRAAFAHVFSRFGVMFFDDPVAAFGNIRKALKAKGRLTFVCWRGLDENPWMSIPLGVALEFVAPPDIPPPEAPGPFALADRERVEKILAQAGYAEISLEALDETLLLGGPGTAAEAADFATRMGPLARALGDSGEDIRQRVETALGGALAPYHDGTGVRMASACWIVSAAAP